MSPKPTTSHPSVSAIPSYQPTAKKSEHPSASPTISASPTTLKNAEIYACQCKENDSFDCIDEPVDPSGSRRM